MKIGFTSVLYLSEEPVTPQEERPLILAHAYKLAYQDFLSSSISKRISRFLHLTKPKRISVIARLAYELSIIPFSETEVLISDSCSSCTDIFQILSFDFKSLNDSVDDLRVKFKTIHEQSNFIEQLKTINLITNAFRKDTYHSPFLPGSHALVLELQQYIQTLGTPKKATPSIEPAHKAAKHPEKLSVALSLFLKNCDNYVPSLEYVRNRVNECCRQMIDSIMKRYPIQQHQLNTKLDFGWKIPDINFNKRQEVLSPVEDLILGLELEIQPEIDEIEKEKKREIERLEQNAKLDIKEIEQNFKIEREQLESNTKLLLKRYKSEENSYESQLDLLRTEYYETINYLQDATDEYDESVSVDSFLTAERLLEKIGRLRRNRDGLGQKIRSVEQTLSSVRSDDKNTERRYEESLEILQRKKKLKIKKHKESLNLTLSALNETCKRKINDKIAHITTIKQEKNTLKEFFNEIPLELTEHIETSEQVGLKNLWHDETFLKIKTGAIDNLERHISTDIGDALNDVEQIRIFLQDHLVKANTASSVPIKLLVPFWYIEIVSGSIDNPVNEVHIVSPSEIIIQTPEENEKSILYITYLSTLPSVTSTLDSIKEDPNVQLCAHSNNQYEQLNPEEIFPTDHWIISKQLISKKFYDLLCADFKKRFLKK